MHDNPVTLTGRQVHVCRAVLCQELVEISIPVAGPQPGRQRRPPGRRGQIRPHPLQPGVPDDAPGPWHDLQPIGADGEEMRLTPQRPHPEKEDYFLASASFNSEAHDGFWTEHRCYCRSWLSRHADGAGRSALAIWRSRSTPRERKRCARCLGELRRQTALHRLLLQAPAQ